MKKGSLIFALLASLSGIAVPRAQVVPETFRTGTRLVYTPIVATDSKGRLVHDLQPGDVRLYDNGHLRTIHFEENTGPLSLAVVVQADWASKKVLQAVKGVGSMIGPLVVGEGGTVALISYHFDVHIEQGFTESLARFKTAISGLAAGGTGSSLLDATSVGIDLLATQPEQRRRILLLVNQGRDSNSKTKLEEALFKAQREKVTVYSIGYSSLFAQLSGKPGAAP